MWLVDLAVCILKYGPLDFVVRAFHLNSISMRCNYHLNNLVFLVRTVSYGTLFFPQIEVGRNAVRTALELGREVVCISMNTIVHMSDKFHKCRFFRCKITFQNHRTILCPVFVIRICWRPRNLWCVAIYMFVPALNNIRCQSCSFLIEPNSCQSHVKKDYKHKKCSLFDASKYSNLKRLCKSIMSSKIKLEVRSSCVHLT